MARDYARSSNIIYNPVEAEQKRHSSGRDYRKAVGESGSRDYRTATVKQEEQKVATPALPALPTLGESVNRMNSMAVPSTYGNVTPSAKLGIVAPQNNAFKQSTEEQKKATAKLMATAPTVRTYSNVEKEAEPFNNLRKAPIIGPIYRGLDRLQEFTEPAAKIAQEFYTPGAGLAPIAGFTGAVGSAISKVAPKLGLGEGLGKAVAREAIKEGAAGAVLGAGQSLAAHPERGLGYEGAGSGALYGGVLGGALGPAAPILGKAIKGVGKYVQNIARETTADNLAFQNAVNQIGESSAKAEVGKRNLADLDEQIQSLSSGNVANKAEQFNALANDRNAVIDYIKQHEPDFEAPKPRVRVANEPVTVRTTNEPTAPTRSAETVRDYRQSVNDNESASTTGGQTTFKTSKGSTYTVGEGGTTQRTKTLHEGHDPNDTGLKEPSEATVYVPFDEATRIGSHFGMNKEARPQVLFREDGIYLVSWNSKENRWGLNGKPIPYTKNPEIGKSPIEMWKISDDPQLGRKASKVHAGNEIVELNHDPTQTGSNRRVEYLPDAPESKTNKSSYYNTIERSGQFNPETQAALNQVDQRYEQIHNVDTVAKANERVKDLEEASQYAAQEGKLTAEQVATGIRAMQEHQRLGNVKSAVSLAQSLARKLTEAGQAIQVASIIDRLSPEGALIYAQRKVADINRRLPKGVKDVEITPAIAEDITQVATASQKAGASADRAGDVLSILQKLRSGKAVTAEERATLQSFVDDAAQFTKKETKERKLPEALSEPRKRDKIISFLEQQESAAKERLRQRKGAANSLPLDVWADYTYIGALKLARNTVKFADWSEAMVRDIGDDVKPYLERLFQSSHDKLAEQAERITARPKTARQVANDELKAAVEDIQGDVLAAIEKSKTGKLDPQEFEDLITKAIDVAELLPESKAPNPDKEMLSAIKQLVKKLAGVENEKIAPEIAFREVKDLVRRITNIGKELETRTRRTPLDTKALDDMAYGLLDRATPSQAEKVTTRYIKKNIDNLSPDDIELIHGMAKDVSRLSKDEQRVASQDLQAIMNNFEKAGIGRKISAAQYISLLLNPLTQIKNVVGNDMLYRFNRLGRVLSTPVDMAISKATGKPRQITFKSGPSVWDDYFKTTKDYFQGLERGGKAGARGTNPEGLTTAYDIGGKAFTHKLNPLNYLESALGATMKGFDYAAYNRAVQQRMREIAYLDAINKKIPKDQIRNHIDTYIANIDDNVAAIAKEYGKKITLQDDSMLARGLTAVKRGLNFGRGFGLGNLVVPFAKTPANLLNRAIDYSPAGFIKAIYNLNKVLRSRETDLTRADVIQNVVEAVLGSGVTGVALWLADKGVLRGSSTFDKDTKSLEKKAGLGEFQLNATALQRMLGAIATGNLDDVNAASKLQPGDNMYAYAWAQPLSMPVAVGSNIVKSIKDTKRAAEKGQKAPSKLLQAIDVTTGGLNTLYSSSVLEGLQNAFDFQTGDTNQIKSFFKNVIKQVPSMAVPSFVRMLNTISDNQQRELYSDSYTKGLLNQATSKIPGLAQKLPVKRDSLGDPVTVPNNFVDTFLNPAKRSVYNPDSNAEFIINLINETDDESIAPRVPDKTLSGTDLSSGKTKSVALTGEQYSRLQKLIGEHVAIGISKIKNVGTTEDKVKAIKKVLNEAGTYGRNILKAEVGLKQSR